MVTQDGDQHRNSGASKREPFRWGQSFGERPSIRDAIYTVTCMNELPRLTGAEEPPSAGIAEIVLKGDFMERLDTADPLRKYAPHSVAYIAGISDSETGKNLVLAQRLRPDGTLVDPDLLPIAAVLTCTYVKKTSQASDILERRAHILGGRDCK